MPEQNYSPEKMMAAHTLGNELFDLIAHLEKAEILMQEICGEYFNKYDNERPEDRLSIAWEYKRHRIYSEILTDYLIKIRDELNVLRILEDKGAELAQQEHESVA